MRLLEALASAFINTFGITQPTEKTRRTAAWLILALLILVAIGMVTLGTILIRVI